MPIMLNYNLHINSPRSDSPASAIAPPALTTVRTFAFVI